MFGIFMLKVHVVSTMAKTPPSEAIVTHLPGLILINSSSTNVWTNNLNEFLDGSDQGIVLEDSRHEDDTQCESEPEESELGSDLGEQTPTLH